MNSPFKSPFEGEPRTVQETGENGGIVLYVAPKALTANMAQVAELLVLLTMFWMWALGSEMIWREPFDPVNAALLAVLPFPLRPLFRKIWRAPLRLTTQLRFTEKSFAVLRGGQWETFDRQLPHRFVLLPHDKTQAERDEYEYDQRKASFSGRAIMPVRYYGNSFVVCFEYLGQRNDILEVFGPKEAQAILTRLNACDGVMDAQLKKGNGTSFDPADEWSDQPGDIRTPA